VFPFGHRTIALPSWQPFISSLIDFEKVAFESNNHEMAKLWNSLSWKNSYVTMNPELDSALVAIQQTNSDRPTSKTAKIHYSLLFFYRIIDVMAFYGGGFFHPRRSHPKVPALSTFKHVKVNNSFHFPFGQG
jgi:hypothetical protein